jgi:hypothetical protein
MQEIAVWRCGVCHRPVRPYALEHGSSIDRLSGSRNKKISSKTLPDWARIQDRVVRSLDHPTRLAPVMKVLGIALSLSPSFLTNPALEASAIPEPLFNRLHGTFHCPNVQAPSALAGAELAGTHDKPEALFSSR